MKQFFILIVLSLFASQLNSQTRHRTVHFTSVFSGSINYSSLTDALTAAVSGDTIWVAAGTYKENELKIPSGITVIGGFPVTATKLSDRIYPGVATTSQLSILDGNYSHRVTTVTGTLDGFVITKGYVYDATSDQSQPLTGNGGGVLIDGGTVQNCILHDNIAAKLAPTPGSIPGTYVASVGDIYCSDGTILKPTYTINSTGQMIATLTGRLGGKTAQGIVFYVDSSPTSGHFLIMGKVSSTPIQPWINPSLDISGISNINSINEASTDFFGRSETDSIIAYIPRYLAAHTDQYNHPTVSYDAIKYAYEYNVPNDTKGQWYLPAAGEINKLWEVRPQMDACARDILQWIPSGSTMFNTGVFWSSSENSNDNIWVLNNYNVHSSTLDTVAKTGSGYTIPIASKAIVNQ